MAAPFCTASTVNSSRILATACSNLFPSQELLFISHLVDTFEKIPFICPLINGLITARIVVSRDQHAFWLREVKFAENVRE